MPSKGGIREIDFKNGVSKNVSNSTEIVTTIVINREITTTHLLVKAYHFTKGPIALIQLTIYAICNMCKEKLYDLYSAKYTRTHFLNYQKKIIKNY